MEERVVTLRMFLFFTAGLVAFATPFMLFPDRYSSTLQLGNVKERNLFRHLLRRYSLLGGILGLMIVMICVGDVRNPMGDLLTKTIYTGVGLLTFAGLALMAISRYTRSGIDSQFWKESEKGRELRRQFADYLKYPLDPGAVPSLINTIMITALGMISVSIGALLSGMGAVWMELIPAAAVFGVGIRSASKTFSGIERYFYATQAFFKEFFGVTVKEAESREAVRVDQLWWVPGPIKSHVWAMLLQLDRKFPAGRVLLLGHLLIWFISYQRPGAEVMTTVWLLFAIAHHAIVVISFSPEFAPSWWQRWSGSTFKWVMTRFWMQFRWILLLGFSFWVNALIFGVPDTSALTGIIAAYLAFGLVISLAGQLYQSKKGYS